MVTAGAETDLPPVGKPAAAALAKAGYSHLEDLKGVPPAELLALHGVGPKAVRLIDEALRALASTETP